MMGEQIQHARPVHTLATRDISEEKDLEIKVEEFLKNTKYCRLPEKPPLSQSALITMAIVTSQQNYVISTKGIFNFISANFVHYQGNNASTTWMDDVRECLKNSFILHSKCKCNSHADILQKIYKFCDEDLWTVNAERAARTVRVAIMADRENAGQLKRTRSSDEDSNPDSFKRVKTENEMINDSVKGPYRSNEKLKKYCEELAVLSIHYRKPPLTDTSLLITIAILGNAKEILTTSEIVKSVSTMFPYVRKLDIALLRNSVLEKLDAKKIYFERLPEQQGEPCWKLKFDNVKVFNIIERVRIKVLRNMQAEHRNGKIRESSLKITHTNPTKLRERSIKSSLSPNRNCGPNTSQNEQQINTNRQQNVDLTNEEIEKLIQKCIAKTLHGYVTVAEAECYIGQRRGLRPFLGNRIDSILRNRPDLFLEVRGTCGFWSLLPESSPKLSTSSSVTSNSNEQLAMPQIKELSIAITRCPIVEKKLAELQKKLHRKRVKPKITHTNPTKLRERSLKSSLSPNRKCGPNTRQNEQQINTNKQQNVKPFKGWIVPTPNTFRASVHRLISQIIIKTGYEDVDYEDETTTFTNPSTETKDIAGFDFEDCIFRGWGQVKTNSRDLFLQKIRALENSEDLEKVLSKCVRGSSATIKELLDGQKDSAEQEPLFTFPVLIVSAIVNDPTKNFATTEDIFNFIEDRFPFYRRNRSGWHRVVRHILENCCKFKKDRYGNWSVDPDIASDIIGFAVTNLRLI